LIQGEETEEMIQSEEETEEMSYIKYTWSWLETKEDQRERVEGSVLMDTTTIQKIASKRPRTFPAKLPGLPPQEPQVNGLKKDKSIHQG
jgi:hypothetical protein